MVFSDNLTDLNKAGSALIYQLMSRANLLHLQDLINLGLGEPKTCAIIYVSVDTTQSAIEYVAKNKPFMRMSLLDSSDFAVMESHDNMDSKKRVAMDEVLRDEDFITGEVSCQNMPRDGGSVR